LTRSGDKRYHYDVPRRLTSMEGAGAPFFAKGKGWGMALNTDVFSGGMASPSAAMFCG
jgi:hypothetical protein